MDLGGGGGDWRVLWICRIIGSSMGMSIDPQRDVAPPLLMALPLRNKESWPGPLGIRREGLVVPWRSLSFREGDSRKEVVIKE